MPVVHLTAQWSDPIVLQQGDILQNRGGYPVEVHPGNPDADPAALSIPGYGGAMLIERAATMRARASFGSGTLTIVSGF